jgi:hypothetical protein
MIVSLFLRAPHRTVGSFVVSFDAPNLFSLSFSHHITPLVWFLLNELTKLTPLSICSVCLMLLFALLYVEPALRRQI